MTLVKICGLTTSETVEAAIGAGADYLGFVLYPRSPRALTPERVVPLLAQARGRARSVILLVDPDEPAVAVAQALSPELIQLHGRETPQDVAALRTRTGLGVIKALPVQAAEDLLAASGYETEHLMFDAKPPSAADRPGGHGASFDWTLLSDKGASGPLWFLAGGLTPANVAEAIRITGAPAVDVSSGVESAPGVKDPALIAAFVRAAKAA